MTPAGWLIVRDAGVFFAVCTVVLAVGCIIENCRYDKKRRVIEERREQAVKLELYGSPTGNVSVSPIEPPVSERAA